MAEGSGVRRRPSDPAAPGGSAEPDGSAPRDRSAELERNAPQDARARLRGGPGRLLILVYLVFTVGAASRSLYQLTTRFDEAPLAYLLSAGAALVYAFITVTLVRGGETARRAALGACVAELVGVLAVGVWTVVDPGAFPDSTVWSHFGMGYLFIPLVLPVTGLLWLRGARRRV